MINSLHIKNFQSHSDTELELDQGVNVIIGLSDTGKSAIIRALKWLVFNRPLGEAFRSNWGGDTFVDIDASEGQVQRLKTDKDNLYLLAYHDEFKALGSDVPDEIKQTLNLNELNFQGQVDPHFLFSSSPGEVASHINRVTNLDKIDLGLKNLNSKIKKLNQRETNLVEQIEQLEEEQKALKYVHEFDGEVTALERMEHEWGQKSILSGKLLKIAMQAREIQERLKDLEWVDKASKRLSTLEDKMGQLNELKKSHDGLAQLHTDILNVKSKIHFAKEALQAKPDYEKVMEWIGEKEKLDIQHKKLSDLIHQINTTQMDIDIARKEYQDKKQLFEKLMPGVCPLCGQGVE